MPRTLVQKRDSTETKGPASSSASSFPYPPKIISHTSAVRSQLLRISTTRLTWRPVFPYRLLSTPNPTKHTAQSKHEKNSKENPKMASLRLSPITIHRPVIAPRAPTVGPTSASLRFRPIKLVRRRSSRRSGGATGGSGLACATMADSASSSYAMAIADVASANNTLDATAADLEKVESALSEPGVEEFLADPIVSEEAKLEFIADVAKTCGLQTHVADFLSLLVDSGRIEVLKEIIAEFELVHNDMTNTEVATVASVVKMESQELAQIAQSLQRLTGAKNVRLKTVIDPDLIAGFTIRYGYLGSKLIDMSVRKQLQEIASEVDLSNITLAAV